MEEDKAILAGDLSQSERDWAFAKRALARGDDPEEVIRRIADYRSEDKHDPNYYARLTVAKAQEQLKKNADQCNPKFRENRREALIRNRLRPS